MIAKKYSISTGTKNAWLWVLFGMVIDKTNNIYWILRNHSSKIVSAMAC